MADEYGTIAAALVTKADTVSELRAVHRNRTAPAPLPRFRLTGPPTMQGIDYQSGSIEEFTLIYPFEVRVAAAGQRERAEVTATRLMRALQVAFQNDVKLGMPTLIWHSRIDSMEPVDEFDDGTYGFEGAIRVECREVLSSART